MEGLLHCVIQIEHGLRSAVDAFRLQEVVKPLYLNLQKPLYRIAKFVPVQLLLVLTSTQKGFESPHEESTLFEAMAFSCVVNCSFTSPCVN